MARPKLLPKNEPSMSIKHAGQVTDVEIHTLRYWESEFSEFLQPLRTEGGQRRYRQQDIEAVITIKRLLRDELFSVAGARKWLRDQHRSAA